MEKIRKTRKSFIGKVVSDATDKTISVLVTQSRQHPLYGKRIETSNKLAAHDENNEAKVGDIVKIMETRPLSKTKHFRLVEIIEKAIIV